VSQRLQLAAAGRSFLRVLAVAAGTAYASLGKASPLDLTREDLRPFAAALLGALLLTAVNWARAGDARFGATSTSEQPAPAGQPLPPLPESAYGPDPEPLEEQCAPGVDWSGHT
jgi:hypothetical protein